MDNGPAIEPIDRSLLQDKSFTNVTIKLPASLKAAVDKMVELGMHYSISDYIRDAIIDKVKNDFTFLSSFLGDDIDKKIDIMRSIPDEKARVISELLVLARDVFSKWKRESAAIERVNKKKHRTGKSH